LKNQPHRDLNPRPSGLQHSALTTTLPRAKKKINQNELIVTKADKSNTLVILHKEDYKNKILEFVNQNDFMKLLHDITHKEPKLKK
jgi:hypothetical protein